MFDGRLRGGRSDYTVCCQAVPTTFYRFSRQNRQTDVANRLPLWADGHHLVVGLGVVPYLGGR